MPYTRIENTITDAIFAVPPDDYRIRWGLEALYKMSLCATWVQHEYIAANLDKLIAFCLRKPRDYAGLRKHINARIK